MVSFEARGCSIVQVSERSQLELRKPKLCCELRRCGDAGYPKTGSKQGLPDRQKRERQKLHKTEHCAVECTTVVQSMYLLGNAFWPWWLSAFKGTRLNEDMALMGKLLGAFLAFAIHDCVDAITFKTSARAPVQKASSVNCAATVIKTHRRQCNARSTTQLGSRDSLQTCR